MGAAASRAHAAAHGAPALRAVSALLVVIMAGCAAPPPERVVLLPADTERPIGGVVVRSGSAEVVLAEPFAEATVSRDGRVQAARSDAATVEQRYGRWLVLRPAAPRVWTLLFDTGRERWDEAALEALLPALRESLAADPSAQLRLTGHTDSVGAVEDNDRLSLRRATLLRDELVRRGLPEQRLQAVGRGEREPRVATPDEVPEPANRRVEITLR
jgi:outer membrane protein OmpA-like peptidoglycan-associated protein